ncbi:MAG: hypothetical protein JNL11_16985 [Bdellovibrionaceae bacterium]|nr:hypothetical protein [Pseudobdellovibrionaceae bacterium]
MKIPAKQLSKSIKTNIDKMSVHLPLRIQNVLDDFANEELADKDEIDLFEALVRLVFIADREPAECITNLMVPLDTEAVHLLDSWTLSNSAAFLRDYLKRKEVLETLATPSPRESATARSLAK